MFPASDTTQKVNHFFRARDDRQFFRHLGSRDEVGKGPVFPECDSVEEAQRGDGYGDRELAASFFSFVK